MFLIMWKIATATLLLPSVHSFTILPVQVHHRTPSRASLSNNHPAGGLAFASESIGFGFDVVFSPSMSNFGDTPGTSFPGPSMFESIPAGYHVFTSAILPAIPSSLGIVMDPDSETDVLVLLSHVVMDLPPVFQIESKMISKIMAMFGRFMILSADYLPDHSVSHQELAIQAVLLLASVGDVFNAVRARTRSG